VLALRKTLTSQPQYFAQPDPAFKPISQCLPAGAGWVELVPGGTAWTANNTGSLAASVCAAGASVQNTGTGYFSRTNPVTAGPLTVVIVFTPTSVTGGNGIWSISTTPTSPAPHAVLQRNGADIRLWWQGSYRITFTGAAVIGVPLRIILTFDTISDSVAQTARLSVNGATQTASASFAGNASKTTEYLGSGYNAQAQGHYSFYARSNRYLDDVSIKALSQNPWSIFQPRVLAIPAYVAAGGDVSVAITGASASCSVGSLVSSLSVAASGVAGSASVGSLSAAISVALSGLSATSGAGTVTASTAGDVTVSVSGVSAVVSAGTVVPALSLTVSGSSASASAGTVTRSQSVSLTGASATGFAGSVTTSGGVVQVRTKGLRKTRYTPGRVPANQQGLAQFLQAELERLTDGLESPFTHQILEKLNVEPSRKLSDTALIAYADGTNWNPGSGEGVYAYYGGSWHKLG